MSICRVNVLFPHWECKLRRQQRAAATITHSRDQIPIIYLTDYNIREFTHYLMDPCCAISWLKGHVQAYWINDTRLNGGFLSLAFIFNDNMADGELIT